MSGNKTNATPIVSVVIPTYNMRELVGRAIESVLNQTYRDFELIVVDDGSTDGTRDIESKYRFDRRFNYIYQANHGLSAARNTGVRASKGKYIGFLDADDSWLPHKLASQVGSMEKHPEIGLIYSDLYFFDVDLNRTIGTFSEWGRHELPAGFIFQQLILDNFISSPTPVVSRKALEDVGLFDETMIACEDWDLWLRISARYPILVIREPLAIYSVRSGSMSKDIEKMYKCSLKVQEKALEIARLEGIPIHNEKEILARTTLNHGALQLSKGQISSGIKKLMNAMRLCPFNFYIFRSIIKSFIGLLIRDLRL